MVAQLKPPIKTLPWLLPPELPDREERRPGGILGFRRDDTGCYALSRSGEEAGPVAQRILLRYALGYETRAQLACRYSMSERHVQGIICGDALQRFTTPLRRVLTEHGIAGWRANRAERRAERVNAAVMRLAMQAAAILRNPAATPIETAQNVATNLWLLTGAWREDEA